MTFRHLKGPLITVKYLEHQQSIVSLCCLVKSFINFNPRKGLEKVCSVLKYVYMFRKAVPSL